MAVTAAPVAGPPTARPATKDLSLILSCYNAAGYLDRNIQRLFDFLSGLHRSFELLVVEDASTDSSLAILRRLEAAFPGLVVLRNPANMGKGFSIRNGILNSSGRLIIFTDPDMAYSTDNLAAVLQRLEAGCPMVTGNRRLPDSFYTVNNRLVRYVYRRHRTGMAFNWLVRGFFGLAGRDTQSGLKGFQRQVAMELFERVHTNGFLFDVELFICAKRLGCKVEEIPVHLTYQSDESTVAQLRYFVRLVPELIRIKWLDLNGQYGPHRTAESRPISGGPDG